MTVSVALQRIMCTVSGTIPREALRTENESVFLDGEKHRLDELVLCEKKRYWSLNPQTLQNLSLEVTAAPHWGHEETAAPSSLIGATGAGSAAGSGAATGSGAGVGAGSGAGVGAGSATGGT